MKKQSFIRGSLILMISAAAAKLLGAMFRIPLTNLLGGVGMSYFSCAYSIFMPVYAFVVTGISSAVARLTAQSTALGMHANTRRIRSTAHAVFSAAGILGGILTAVLAEPFCVYTAGCPEAVPGVIMIAPSVFFGCITAVERGYYEGMCNMYPTAFSQLAEGIIKMISGLLLCGYVMKNGDIIMEYIPYVSDIRSLAAAAGILGVTLSSVGAALLFAVIGLFSRRACISSGDNTLMSRREICRELLSVALPSGISAVVTNLTSLIDMGTVIGCLAYFGCAAVMPYGISAEDMPNFVYGSFAGIALTVFNLIPSVTNMLGRGVLPAVTQAWENGDREELSERTSQALFTAAAIAVPAAFGLGALSGEALHFLFPAQNEEVRICITALRYLMPGMVCLCISSPVFSMLQAVGRASLPLKVMLMGAGIKLIGNLLFVPFMAADGAAVSTSVCYIVILAVSLRIYLKTTGIVLPVKPFAGILYSGAMCCAAAYLVSDIMTVYGFGNTTVLFISTAVGGVVYIALMAVLRESGEGTGMRTVQCKTY